MVPFEVAQMIADRELRRQHKPRSMSKADKADETRWTNHDNKHDRNTPYAVCGLCFPKGD